jgi:hypothetical protein
MLREHRPAEWIDLNLPFNFKSGPREPQVEPADPREQTANRESWGVSHV